MGIGDWGLGIGDWAQSPIPNPHVFNLINFNVFIKQKNNIRKVYKNIMLLLNKAYFLFLFLFSIIILSSSSIFSFNRVIS